MDNNLSWAEFEKVEMRIGTIIEAEFFKESRKPAYKLKIDFGPLGIKKSSAQITALYQSDELIGKQIVAVMNFPAKQIVNIMSECLVLGAVTDETGVVLLSTERRVDNGTRIG
jgi:tRNA-binding protein